MSARNHETNEPAPLDRTAMRSVARGWGRVADRYVAELFDELDRKPFDRDLLAQFAACVPPGALVGDVGCGPGHIAHHLMERGLRVHGVDLCEEMVEAARRLVPGATFEVGDMLALPVADGVWGGCLAMYSLINLVREDVGVVLAGFARVLQPEAPLLLAVHRGQGVVHEPEVFGVPLPMVATLYEPDELEAWVREAGFMDVDVRCRPPYESEYPSERVYVLARRG